MAWRRRLALVFLSLYILLFPALMPVYPASASYDYNETLNYTYTFSFSINNSTVVQQLLNYFYNFFYRILEAYRFAHCQGWEAVASYTNLNTSETQNVSFAALCIVPSAEQIGGFPVFKISRPGLFSPEALFALLLFLAMIIVFGKIMDFYIAFAVASSIMMVVSLIYFDIRLFFVFLIGTVFAVALRLYGR